MDRDLHPYRCGRAGTVRPRSRRPDTGPDEDGIARAYTHVRVLLPRLKVFNVNRCAGSR